MTGWELAFELPDRAYAILANVACPRTGKQRRCTNRAMIPVMHAINGFPDLLLTNATLGATVAIELKTETGKAKDAQRRKLWQLNRGGICAFICRPRHADDLVAYLESGRCPIVVEGAQ